MISVIVPCYNLQNYISSCLESLIHQTHKDFEIIIVDDGSSDHSPDIIKGYSKKDPRVVLIEKTNGGVSSARNLGLEHARGDLIAFVDGDDYVAPDYLEFLLDCLTEDSVLSMCKAVDPPLDTFDYGFDCERTQAKYFTAEECAKWLLEGRFFPRVWGALFRKSMLESLYFKEANNGEDKLFLFEYLLTNKDRTVAVSNACLYGYCYRQGSATKKVWNGSKDAVDVEETMLHLTEQYYPEGIEQAQVNCYAARLKIMKEIILSGNRSEYASSIYREMLMELNRMSFPNRAGHRMKIEHMALMLGDPVYKLLVKTYYALNDEERRHRYNESRKIKL